MALVFLREFHLCFLENVSRSAQNRYAKTGFIFKLVLYEFMLEFTLDLFLLSLPKAFGLARISVLCGWWKVFWWAPFDFVRSNLVLPLLEIKSFWETKKQSAMWAILI